MGEAIEAESSVDIGSPKEKTGVFAAETDNPKGLDDDRTAGVVSPALAEDCFIGSIGDIGLPEERNGLLVAIAGVASVGYGRSDVDGIAAGSGDVSLMAGSEGAKGDGAIDGVEVATVVVL